MRFTRGEITDKGLRGIEAALKEADEIAALPADELVNRLEAEGSQSPDIIAELRRQLDEKFSG